MFRIVLILLLGLLLGPSVAVAEAGVPARETGWVTMRAVEQTREALRPVNAVEVLANVPVRIVDGSERTPAPDTDGSEAGASAAPVPAPAIAAERHARLGLCLPQDPEPPFQATGPPAVR